MVCVVVRALPLCGPAWIELPGHRVWVEVFDFLLFFFVMNITALPSYQKPSFGLNGMLGALLFMLIYSRGTTQEKINKIFALLIRNNIGSVRTEISLK